MGFLPGRGSILSITSLSAVLSAHHSKIVAHVRDGHPRRFEACARHFRFPPDFGHIGASRRTDNAQGTKLDGRNWRQHDEPKLTVPRGLPAYPLQPSDKENGQAGTRSLRPKEFAHVDRAAGAQGVGAAGRVAQHLLSYNDTTWLAERHAPAHQAETSIAVLGAALVGLAAAATGSTKARKSCSGHFVIALST
jgi:hypothetical protein